MHEHFLPSLIASCFVSAAAAYLGSLMITRRMALVGDALGHVALPGMGLAFMLGMDVGIGAFAFLLAAVVVIWYLGEITELSTETLVGVLFVGSLSLGFMLVPEQHMLESLIGDLSTISQMSAWIAGIISVLVFLVTSRIASGMFLISISADLAAVHGINTRRYAFVFLLLIAIVVALGVKVTGSLLVGALLIVPPATARMLARDLRSYASLSVLAGVLSSLVGMLLSAYAGLPVGPTIILSSVVMFVASFGARWMRRWSA